MPVPQAQKVLVDAKQKPILEEKISLLNTDITLLNQRIEEKDKIIADLKLKEGNNQAIITALQDEKAIMLEQRKIFEDQIKTFEVLLRKEKRKRKFTAALGAVATGAAIFFSFRK